MERLIQFKQRGACNGIFTKRKTAFVTGATGGIGKSIVKNYWTMELM